MLLKWISGFNFTGNQNWPNFLNISFVCLCWSLTLSACICMHAYVCARMCICMHERDRIELRTWLLKPPGAQSQSSHSTSFYLSFCPQNLPSFQSCSALQPWSIPSYFKLSLSFLCLINAHSNCSALTIPFPHLVNILPCKYPFN